MTATTPDRSTAPLAWTVTLLLLAATIVIVVLAAFSQNNTPTSVDGTTATSTHWEINGG